MKVLGTLLILLLMIVGIERAFLSKETSHDFLSTRQKIEITYRNAISVSANGTLDPESLNLVENEIQILVKKDPFLNKKDRLWVKEKLKNLKEENLGSLAMRSLR